VLTDPIWERSGHRLKGRDGCRVPIPWTQEPPSFGFGPGGSWLPMPESWGALSVAAQSGRTDSTLELYRRCLAIRTERLWHDEFAWIGTDDDVISFRRGALTCVVNFGVRPTRLPGGEVVAASDEVGDGVLPTEATVWLVA